MHTLLKMIVLVVILVLCGIWLVKSVLEKDPNVRATFLGVGLSHAVPFLYVLFN